MESKIQDTIEVFLGDEEDPATYWMILKSDLPRVNKIGKTLCDIDSRGKIVALEDIKANPRKLFAVKDKKRNRWYRARILEIIPVGGHYEIEAFLVDYGQNLHRIQYPRGVSYLIDNLDKIDPIAFKFSLNGVIPIKESYRYVPDTNRKLQAHRIREWTEIALAFAHLTSTFYSRSWIKPEIMSADGKPSAGVLHVEIFRANHKFFRPFMKVLTQGGFSPQFPIYNVAQCLINEKLAICVEALDLVKYEAKVTPVLTKHRKRPSEEYNLPPPPVLENVEPRQGEKKKDTDEVASEMRRMRLFQELKGHMEPME